MIDWPITRRRAPLQTSSPVGADQRPGWAAALPDARTFWAGGLAAAVIWWLAAEPVALPSGAAPVLAVFLLALIGWSVLRWPETPVALAACLALVALGPSSLQDLHASLGHSLIWLLIGAFLMAAVLQQSGLAERWTMQLVSGARSTQGLFWRLSGVILLTAFVVPSTSGRAALLLPVFVTLARCVGDRQIVRALALLFPSVILLSACASLLGAGAHLLAAEFMERFGAEPVTFATWAAWGVPFALASSACATGLILSLFMDGETRARPLKLACERPAALTHHQKWTALIAALTLLAWATTGWHGSDASLIAMVGGLIITCKPLTGMDMKSALKKVEWNLVLFLAATLVMGEALVQSGAARWIADAALRVVPLAELEPMSVILLAAVIALVSHLLIPSRTARALVLLPTVALPLAANGLNPALLVMVCVMGSGFCQTLVISAKPVALFARAELPAELGQADHPIDGQLLKLSLALLPLMLVLLGGFAWQVWPLLGIPLLSPTGAG